jgi:hypothetical protein
VLSRFRQHSRASSQSVVRAWVTREISNFEYLSHLNFIAGRSLNDLSQYPVFPWVLADYESEQLDLTRASTFRDLRWPMGAQEEAVRENRRRFYEMLHLDYERQKTMAQHEGAAPPMLPFHHGTHYSTAGFVIWFLLRLEPFTSYHLQLQGGKLDLPDRQFQSLATAWRGCRSNPNDNKELLPEFFYLPDFLRNTNQVPLTQLCTFLSPPAVD